jgi:hypothetical protein
VGKSDIEKYLIVKYATYHEGTPQETMKVQQKILTSGGDPKTSFLGGKYISVITWEKNKSCQMKSVW